MNQRSRCQNGLAGFRNGVAASEQERSGIGQQRLICGGETAPRTETDKIAPALGTPVLLGAERNQKIRQKAGIIVFARPGAQVHTQALGTFSVSHFRQQPHTREKAVMAIAAAEWIDTGDGPKAFRKVVKPGAANVSSAALLAFERRTFHVVRASFLRWTAAYSD
jgi:hypothetical protein